MLARILQMGKDDGSNKYANGANLQMATLAVAPVSFLNRVSHGL